MKRQKMNTGITLVALIITIVILIILAVVSITTIMNTDILGYANKSVNSYEKSKDNETETMQGYEDYLAGKGESGSKGNLLKLIDVPETTGGDNLAYSVKDGVITIKYNGNDMYYGSIPGYMEDMEVRSGLSFELPCTLNLKAGKTYKLVLEYKLDNRFFVVGKLWCSFL